MDLRQRSEVVASIGDFKVTRACYDPNKSDIEEKIRDIVGKEVKKWKQQLPNASQP